MYVILGANGHVGSAVALTLLEQGEPVTVVSRSHEKTDYWEQKGAKVAIADAHDTKALNKVFQKGNRLFLLNPPADPSTDTAAEEQKTMLSIIEALEGSGLKKIVAESTYGAQPGEQIGDLGVLYEMEQRLAKISIPFSVIRAAYYMSNWDMSLQSAEQEGKVHTLYPVNFKLPMVAPHDIGQLAAKLLKEPVENTGLHYIEGPQTYSALDVADAFSRALNKPVEAVETPSENWVETLKTLGFSDKAAKSMANMTAITLNQKTEFTDKPVRGSTSLSDYIFDLVNKAVSQKTA